MNRRNFIRSAGGILIAAPMVVKAEAIMKVIVPQVMQGANFSYNEYMLPLRFREYHVAAAEHAGLTPDPVSIRICRDLLFPSGFRHTTKTRVHTLLPSQKVQHNQSFDRIDNVKLLNAWIEYV